MFDGAKFGEEIVAAVRGYVEQATAPLKERIAELEARQPEKGDPGTVGEPGKDAEPVSEEQIAEAVRVYLEANPPAPGQDGEDGKDGEDGQPGKDADPITQDQIIDAIRAAPETVRQAVEEWLEANPPAPGQDGEPGEKGEAGTDGKDGADGRDGDAGKDGVGLAGAFIDRDGGLVVTLTDGSTRELGMVVGRDGRDGVDGQKGERGEAGFSLSDFDIERTDDERTLLLKFSDGDVLNTFELHLPCVIYRGVFKDGDGYEVGDMVTWAGSLWHCNAPTSDKPGEGSAAWTLAAKKGRDGGNGKDGKDGERGPAGKDGKPWG